MENPNTIAIIRMKSQLIDAGIIVRNLDVEIQEDREAIQKIWELWKKSS